VFTNDKLNQTYFNVVLSHFFVRVGLLYVFYRQKNKIRIIRTVALCLQRTQWTSFIAVGGHHRRRRRWFPGVHILPTTLVTQSEQSVVCAFGSWQWFWT